MSDSLSKKNKSPQEWLFFYQEVARKIRKYKNNRSELIVLLDQLFEQQNLIFPQTNKMSQSLDNYIKDICPFTIFAFFNSYNLKQYQNKIVRGLSQTLKINTDLANSLSDISFLNLQIGYSSLWFFDLKGYQSSGEAQSLWSLFDLSVNLTEKYCPEIAHQWLELYDQLIKVPLIQFNLNLGLYWLFGWNQIQPHSIQKQLTPIKKLKGKTPKRYIEFPQKKSQPQKNIETINKLLVKAYEEDMFESSVDAYFENE